MRFVAHSSALVVLLGLVLLSGCDRTVSSAKIDPPELRCPESDIIVNLDTECEASGECAFEVRAEDAGKSIAGWASTAEGQNTFSIHHEDLGGASTIDLMYTLTDGNSNCSNITLLRTIKTLDNPGSYSEEPIVDGSSSGQIVVYSMDHSNWDRAAGAIAFKFTAGAVDSNGNAVLWKLKPELTSSQTANTAYLDVTAGTVPLYGAYLVSGKWELRATLPNGSTLPEHPKGIIEYNCSGSAVLGKEPFATTDHVDSLVCNDCSCASPGMHPATSIGSIIVMAVAWWGRRKVAQGSVE